MSIESTPAPGSDEAIKRGCTCPIMDNCYGRGFQMNGETVFVTAADCPLHGRNQEGQDV